MRKLIIAGVLALTVLAGVGSANAEGLPDETIVRVTNASAEWIIYVQGFIGNTQILNANAGTRSYRDWYIKADAHDPPMRNYTGPIYVRVFNGNQQKVWEGYIYYGGAKQPNYELRYPVGR
jgi:hypothetical protein